jgi:hypothetical protein
MQPQPGFVLCAVVSDGDRAVVQLPTVATQQMGLQPVYTRCWVHD